MGIPKFLTFLKQNFPTSIIQRGEHKPRFDYLLLECDNFSHRARHSCKTIAEVESFIFRKILSSLTKNVIAKGVFFIKDGAASVSKGEKTFPSRFKRKVPKLFRFMHQINTMEEDEDETNLDISELLSSVGANITEFRSSMYRAFNHALEVVLSWGKIGGIAEGSLEAEHKMLRMIEYCREIDNNCSILTMTPDADVIMIMLGLGVSNVYVNVEQNKKSIIVNIDVLRQQLCSKYHDWRNIVIMHGLLANDYCIGIIRGSVWKRALDEMGSRKQRFMVDGIIDKSVVKDVLQRYAINKWPGAEPENEEDDPVTEEDVVIATRYWEVFRISIASYIHGTPSTLNQPTVLENLTPRQRRLIVDLLDSIDLSIPSPLFADLQEELDANALYFSLARKYIHYPLNLWRYMFHEQVYLAMIDGLIANNLISILGKRIPSEEDVSTYISEYDRIKEYNKRVADNPKEKQLMYQSPEPNWFFPETEEDAFRVISVLEPILVTFDVPGPFMFTSNVLGMNAISQPFMQVFVPSSSPSKRRVKERYQELQSAMSSFVDNKGKNVHYVRYTHSFTSMDQQ
ncbi:hypothetical protein PCE1_004973 [Barthelona sp. PCE]